MKGMHTEFTHIPGVGNALITGIPDECDHDDKESIFLLANGDTLPERKFRCPTDEETLNYVTLVAEERGTTIIGGTSGCSKCGKVLSLQELMGDAYWDSNE